MDQATVITNMFLVSFFVLFCFIHISLHLLIPALTEICIKVFTE